MGSSSPSHCPICTSTRVAANPAGKAYLRLRDYVTLYTCADCTHSWRLPHLSKDPGLDDKFELARGEVRYGKQSASLTGDKKPPFFVLDRLAEVPAGGRILDVGSGNGDVMHYAHTQGFDVWGVDIDLTLNKYPVLTGRIKPSFDEYPDGHFDFVQASHVLEHVEEPMDFANAIFSKLKPGGLFAVEVPNELESLYSAAKRLTGRKSSSATSLYMHQHYFTVRSLDRCLQRARLVPIYPVRTPKRVRSGLGGTVDSIATSLKRGSVIETLARKAS